WEARIEKIELPTNVGDMAQKAANDKQAAAVADKAGASLGGFNPTQTSGVGGAASVVMGQFETIRTALETSLRKVTLRVSWPEGRKEQWIEFSTLVSDRSKVDQSLGGLTAALGALTGAGGGTGPGAGGAGAPGTGTGGPGLPGGFRPPAGGNPFGAPPAAGGR